MDGNRSKPGYALATTGLMQRRTAIVAGGGTHLHGPGIVSRRRKRIFCKIGQKGDSMD